MIRRLLAWFLLVYCCYLLSAADAWGWLLAEPLLWSHLLAALGGAWLARGVGRVLLSGELRQAAIEQAEQGHERRISGSWALWRWLFG